MLVRRDPGAELFANRDAVTDVEFARHRVRRHRTRHERFAVALVVPVTAGRQHDALGCFDINFAVCGLDRGAGDPSVLLFDGGNRRVEQDFDSAFAQAVKQPCDQRIAHHQSRAARVTQPVAGITRHQLRRVSEIGQRAETAEQGRDVGLADHHAAEQHVFGDRRAQPFEIGAEQASVKRLRNDGAAGDRGAFHIAAIIRMPAARQEFDLGVLLQPVDDGRSAPQKRRAQIAARSRCRSARPDKLRLVPDCRRSPRAGFDDCRESTACQPTSTRCRRPDPTSRRRAR